MATIHVVDDESMIRLLVSYVLCSLDHTVETHASADDFFAALAHKPCDLVITDFIMPKVDGFEFCRRLRLDPRTTQVPVIVMSGFELEPLVRESLTARFGVFDILPKPFLAPTLINTARRALAHTELTAVAVPATDDSDEARVASAVRAVGQRLQPRLEASLPVVVSWDDVTLEGTTSNVSASGVFVLAKEAPPADGHVLLSILSTAGKRSLAVKASVAHAGPVPGGQRGFGLTIIERDLQSFYAWYQLVARLQSASAPRTIEGRVLLVGFSEAIAAEVERLIALFSLTRVPVARVARLDELATPTDLALVVIESHDTPSARLDALRTATGARVAVAETRHPADLATAIRLSLALPSRATMRAPLMGEVRLTCGDTESFACSVFNYTLGDIGLGGMRVFGARAIPAEGPVVARFSLPDDQAVLETRATVRWMNRQSPDRLVYGLAFEDVAQDASAAIARYVNEQWQRYEARPV